MMPSLLAEARSRWRATKKHHNKHFTQGCMPGSNLPPEARAVDGMRGTLGDSTSKPERIRSKHIAEKERAAKCDKRWHKHTL